MPIARAPFQMHYSNHLYQICFINENNSVREIAAQMPSGGWIKLPKALWGGGNFHEHPLHVPIEANT